MQFHTKWLHGEVKNDEWPGFVVDLVGITNMTKCKIQHLPASV
jgi:hypothetical protein